MKKFFASISIIAILLSFTTVSYAEDTDSAEDSNVISDELSSVENYITGNESDSIPLINTGVIFLTDEEEEEYLNSLTDEDLQKIHEKEREAEEFANQTVTRSVQKISIPGEFRIFPQ